MRLEEVAVGIQSGNWDSQITAKPIDFVAGQFEANGTTYYLETQLTIGRYCEFVILQRELSNGMTLQQIYDSHVTQRQLLNQVRFADAAVQVDKIINHCVNIKQKEPTVLKLCTLFINTKDEDRTVWNNDTVTRKLEDWKKAGISVADFFAVALTLAPGFIEIYNSFTQSIIEKLGMAQEIVEAAMEA